MPIAFAITVAVVSYAAPALQPRGEAMGRAMQAAARARGAEVVELAEPLVARARQELERGWVAEAELQPLARAREAISDGRRGLERVELERAEAAFGRAEDALDGEHALGWPGAATVRAEAARLRGVALYELGRKGPAAEAWRRAVVLEPAGALTEAEVRPEVVKAYRAAVARGAATARLAVRWDGCGLAATVEIDGKEADGNAVDGKAVDGKAADVAECGLTIAVTPGVHFVRVRGRGRPAGKLVEVGGSDGNAVTLRRGLDDAEPLAREGDRPERAALAAAARVIGLDAVIAVAFGVDRGEPVVYGARVTATGCATEVLREVAVDPGRAAEALMARLTSTEERCGDAGRALDDGRALVEAPGVARPTERPPIATPPTVPAPRPPRGKRVWERPWLWLGVVGVSAAAAIGLGAGLGTRGVTTTATLEARGFAQ